MVTSAPSPAPRARRVLGVLALALGMNAVYLAARSDASLFYFVNLALHLAGGLAFLALVPWLAVRLWRESAWRGRTALVAFGLSSLAAIASAAGAGLAAYDVARPPRLIVPAHVVLAAVAGAAALFSRRESSGWRSPAVTLVALLAVVACGARLAHDTVRAGPAIVNPALPPLTMAGEGGGPTGPFFPSSAETTTGGTIPATLFLDNDACARCHKDIYDQWTASAHRFSSFNNQWYRKSVEYMQDVVGTGPSKWCAGCHDHALLFSGRFDRPVREQIDTPEAQSGLGCVSCHSIVHVKSTMGQGDFTIESPPLHDLATSRNPLLQAAHDYLLHLDPEPHKRTFLKPLHVDQSAEFCSACHKVHLDEPVNAYRWFRGFNEYDNWQASGVSGQGARSFYYPAASQTCRDCHMPLVAADDPAAENGLVRSHRFIGANTALPFVNGDAEQLRLTQEFLRTKAVTVDLFAIVRGEAETMAAAAGRGARTEPQAASTFAVGEESMGSGVPGAIMAPPAEVIGPLDRTAVSVRRGESVRVEVVVRTRGVGHFFPGGTVDAFDVWVELEAVDATGRSLFHSGFVEDAGKGPVEPSAHRYRSLMLDGRGQPVNKRNAWMTRSVAYVRLIPPGAADTVHYRLAVPDECEGPIALRARVRYRKFAWWNTQWAFAGERDPADTAASVAADHDTGRWLFTGNPTAASGRPDAIPDLPITTMAEATASLRVLSKDAPAPGDVPLLDRSVRERWNDYGIGLLLQGDIKGAEAAFLRVTQMDPDYADGWVNAARARLQEGNADGAETLLRRALAIDPDLAKTHFFLGTALKTLGHYDDALSHLRLAADSYPRDRVVANQIGRVLFLQRRFREAATAFEGVLRIDPEDLQAHYNVMLSYQGLGDADRARRHETVYRRFKADESAQAITGPYRQLHPDDNTERQAIHEHRSPATGEPDEGAR